MKITHDKHLKVPTPKKIHHLSCTHGYSLIFLFAAGTFMEWWEKRNTEMKKENLTTESVSHITYLCYKGKADGCQVFLAFPHHYYLVKKNNSIYVHKTYLPDVWTKCSRHVNHMKITSSGNMSRSPSHLKLAMLNFT